MAVIIRDIRNGDVHEVAADILAASRLVAIGKDPKKGGGVRPITIGETLLKVAALTGLLEVYPKLREHFGALQLGILEPGGCERIHHELDAALGEHPNWATLTIDSTNAFNTAYRAVMAQELYRHEWLMPLWGIFKLAYGKPRKLLVTLKDRVETLFSTEGSRQGCVLGSLLFCLALQPILLACQAAFPEITIRCIMDDVNLWGPQEDVIRAYDFLAERLATIGLLVNSKSTLYTTHTDVPEHIRSKVTVSGNAITILGAEKSRDKDFVSRKLVERMEKHETFFHRLELMPPNIALLLLQQCGAARATYLLRTHNPVISHDMAVKFDTRVTKVLESITDTESSPLSRETELLSHLPMREGGIGITRTVWIAQAAYDHSLAESKGQVSTSQEAATEVINKSLGAEVDDMGPVQKAHRRAAKLKFASRWLQAFQMRFPPREFQAALRWRLAIGEGDEAPMNICPGCSTLLDARSYIEHRPGCSRLPRFNSTTIHTACVRETEAIATRSGVSSDHEPRHYELLRSTADGHEQGPDILLHLPTPVAVDVKTINSGSISNCASSINALERRKTVQASTLYKAAVEHEHETLVVAHIHQSGGLSKPYADLLRDIVLQHPDHDFEKEVTTLVVSQQRALAKVLLYHGRRATRNCPPSPKGESARDADAAVSDAEVDAVAEDAVGEVENAEEGDDA